MEQLTLTVEQISDIINLSVKVVEYYNVNFNFNYNQSIEALELTLLTAKVIEEN